MAAEGSTEWEIDGFAISVTIKENVVLCSAFYQRMLYTASWASIALPTRHLKQDPSPTVNPAPPALAEAFMKARELATSTS